MSVLSDKPSDYERHVNGPPKKWWIDYITDYIGEVASLLYYGSRHLVGYVDQTTMDTPDRIVLRPIIKLKQILKILSLFLMATATISFAYSALLPALLCLMTALITGIMSQKTENPVIAIVNGPKQETVAYVTSSRMPGSRETLSGFRKIFQLDKILTADIMFMMNPETGRHAITATRFNNYMTEDKYIFRTFVCAYRIFNELFMEWANDPNPRVIAMEIGMATLRSMTESILGFTHTPLEALDVLEESEDAFSNQTPYWELFGLKIALTKSQRSYLRMRYRYQEVAKKLVDLNKEAVIKHGDNFTLDLAKRIASILGGPEAKAEDYLDTLEVRHGSLAMMLASNNPSTSIMGTMHFLRDYPTETAILIKAMQRLLGETTTMSEEEKLSHLYKRTKSCVDVEEILWYYNESIRMTTPVSVVARSCPFAIKLNGHKIPAGSVLATNVRSQCRDPAEWERPNEFWPARFSKPNYVIHTWPFIPFSVGERKCPGIMTTRALFFGFLFAYAGKYEIIADPTRPPFFLPGDNAINRVSRIHRATLKRL